MLRQINVKPFEEKYRKAQLAKKHRRELREKKLREKTQQDKARFKPTTTTGRFSTEENQSNEATSATETPPLLGDVALRLVGMERRFNQLREITLADKVRVRNQCKEALKKAYEMRGKFVAEAMDHVWSALCEDRCNVREAIRQQQRLIEMSQRRLKTLEVFEKHLQQCNKNIAELEQI